MEEKMSKRFLNVILVFALLVNMMAVMPVSVGAQEFTEGYWTYTVNGREATVTRYDRGASGWAVIPYSLGGYTVTTIKDGAFANCDKMIGVTIPGGVKLVCEGAFDGCSSLGEIVVDEGNGSYATADGILMNKNMNCLVQYPPAKVETSYTIPDYITTVGANAFYGSVNLSEVIIPHSVTSLGDNAFAYCEKLAGIAIPDSINVLENGVFSNSGLYSVEVPYSISIIEDNAFSYCKNLTDVTISDGVTTIGNYAFAYCENLSKVRIPGSVSFVGDWAFAFCDNLKNVKLPSGVSVLGDWSLSFCDNLTSVAIPETITSIGEYASAYCQSLQTVHYAGTAEQWQQVAVYEGNTVLTAGSIVFNSTGEEEEDVPEILTSFGSKVSEWAVPEIEIAFEKGLIPEVMVGYDLTKKVNRGEFAAIALQLYETLIDSYVETPEYCVFTDISGDINEEAIKKAYETQLTAGMSENQYMPLEFINREQLATMLCRVIKKRWFDGWTLANDEGYYLDTTGVNPFVDDADISPWAKPSVYYMNKHGIIAGVGDNKFAPRMTESQQHIADYASATREQALVLSLRIFNKSETENMTWQ